MKTDNNDLDLPAIENAQVSPATALASVALSLALRWVDTTVVKDGTMYQQLKMEQKTINPLGIEDLFDVAKQFEAHLMGAPGRLSTMILEAVSDGLNMEYPCHPGDIFREHIDENHPNSNRAAIADVLEISEERLADFYIGKYDVTAELADRIEMYFDYPAKTLLELQRKYDEVKERRGNADQQTVS